MRVFTELPELLSRAQSTRREEMENALLDLRFLIERATMNRYNTDDEDEYKILFTDQTLLGVKLNADHLVTIRYFLFFLMLNYPDRAVLTAKCIKVLFDTSLREGIINLIRIYMEKDDDATCELIFAIMNVGDHYHINNRDTLDVFKTILQKGGASSREAVLNSFNYYKRHHNNSFSWS